jgi:hypothetical protein
VKTRKRRSKKSRDTQRYQAADDPVQLAKTPANEAGDPFAAFSEWSSDADERAYSERA